MFQLAITSESHEKEMAYQSTNTNKGVNINEMGEVTWMTIYSTQRYNKDILKY